MTYKLLFLPQAKKEWSHLHPAVQEQFKKKLIERLENPEVPKDRLHGPLQNCYKIKLRQVGYRLVYQVDKNEISVLVIAVGRRDLNQAYGAATIRLRRT